MRHCRIPLYAILLLSNLAFAGNQLEAPLSNSVQAQMQQSISDQPIQQFIFSQDLQAQEWLQHMSQRLKSRIPDAESREDFLRTVHYEANRAGLEPELVLGLIQVESGFKKYAVSSAGARGYMQVMPFWTKSIGVPEHNLFHLRLNLRYGCTILRHYLDIEHGDLYRALGRYNGSLGQSQYPQSVLNAWHKNWNFSKNTPH
jgi:soluble lytic murein transglycosylase-like protein